MQVLHNCFEFWDSLFNSKVYLPRGDSLPDQSVESEIIIKDSIFENDLDFSEKSFRKDLIFQRSLFLNNASFHGSVFRGSVDFSNVIFADDADFVHTSFDQNANFFGARFNGTHFNEAFFNEADFSYVYFDESAIFIETTFNKNAHFRTASFKEDAYFKHVIFLADADFKNANFYNKSYFSETTFNKLIFTNTNFLNSVLLGSDFKEISVSWRNIKKVLVYDRQTYIKLIKYFRENQLYHDADDVYYEYRKNERKIDGGFWDLIVETICGYGVKPLRPIGIGLAIIMVFPLIYWLGMSKSAALECSGIAFLSGYNHDFVNNNFFIRFPSLETRMGQISRGLLTGKRFIKFFMFSESLLGWLVLGLFIVTLANVMIRP